MSKPYCCHQGCGKDAEFRIFGSSRLPDDVTEACQDHVGHLLGTPVGQVPESDAWTVVEIASSTTDEPSDTPWREPGVSLSGGPETDEE